MKNNLSNIFKKIVADKMATSKEQLIFHELPNSEIEFISAELIIGILDRGNPHFWNHHGNSKKFYIELANESKRIHEAWCRGASIEKIQNDDQLKQLSSIYLSDQFCVKLYKYPDGKYRLVGDGRHRVAAAQELGLVIPAKVVGEYKISRYNWG